MLRPRPHALALALIITDFVSQLRVAQCRQRVRRNKLAFARREALRIPSPSVVPLRRSAAGLVDPSREHALHVSARSRQRLPQINFFALFGRGSDQRVVLPDIYARNPGRFPVASAHQLPRSRRAALFPRHRGFCPPVARGGLNCRFSWSLPARLEVPCRGAGCRSARAECSAAPTAACWRSELPASAAISITLRTAFRETRLRTFGQTMLRAYSPQSRGLPGDDE